LQIARQRNQNCKVGGIAMYIRYVYKGKMIGGGYMNVIPRTGDFIEYQTSGKIFKVEAVMFKIVLSGDTGAIIYLTDVMSETEDKLRNY
jgi:hypothetical protein